jgi:hypothetical protein
METQKKKSVFETLNAINVNAKTEKKSNLTYLSWAWAWSETKKVCPDATYQIGMTEYDEQLGFMCHTYVTIGGETLEMWLPVMDGANKSMRKESYDYVTRYGTKTCEAATMFDINKTLMRCLVKNLAMFGMGIYIYAGEDLPESDEAVIKAQEKPKAKLPLDLGDENWSKVLKYVSEGKEMGIKKIIDSLSVKYNITNTVKAHITKIVKSNE